MEPSLFRSGLIPRLGASFVFGCAAFGAVFLLREQPPPAVAADDKTAEDQRPASLHETYPTPPSESAATTSEAETDRIEIESIRPVESWTVRLDGETPTDATSDLHHWRGSAPALAAVLSIDTVLASPEAADATANALRIRFRSGDLGIEWLEWAPPGEIAIVPLDQLRASAPPTVHRPTHTGGNHP